jgi:hypothetical protein
MLAVWLVARLMGCSGGRRGLVGRLGIGAGFGGGGWLRLARLGRSIRLWLFTGCVLCGVAFRRFGVGVGR